MRTSAYAAVALAVWIAPLSAVDTVEFNRDIRPILSDKCYTCHGPDKANRQSPLRFDIEQAAKADLGGRFAIVPGNVEKSEIINRITTDDTIRRMPPAYAGAKKLTDREIGLIRAWIEQGAQWQAHWSLIPPKRPAVPKIANPDWARNPIDNFVAQRLERDDLKPSPEASRETLIRRVTLDLTGLPPTPAETDAFLNDRSPRAYETVVDRLLESPRYGERMAVRWLDAARYADTNGYQTDAERYMWRWRDWVIEAFNNNKPFDEFTVEQIAGDMLPNASLDQMIATGFNRNHRGNGEGGIIAEEYAVEYVVDRVETTSTVWLGLTMGCARCHDHKYDPLTQKEFYEFFAYFNNVPERGKAFKYGNSPPFIAAPTGEQQEKLHELDAAVEKAEAEFRKFEPQLSEAQAAWEKSLASTDLSNMSVSSGLVLHHPLDSPAQPMVAKPAGKDAVEPKILDGATQLVNGKLGLAAAFDGRRYVEVGNVANFDFEDNFTLAAWIYPTAPTGAIVTRTSETPEDKGYGMYLKDGKVQANLVLRWLDDCLRLETKDAVPLNQWHHVMFTYDGSRLADGVKIYVNGEAVELNVIRDEMNQPIKSAEPLRIGAGGGPENRFQGYIDDVRVYAEALTPAQAAVVATGEPLHVLAYYGPKRRTQAQSDKMRLAFLDNYAPEPMRAAWTHLVAAKQARANFADSLPTVMVMRERETPRQTYQLIRGAYDAPGEPVDPGVPSALPPLPAGAPNNRLGFARWLVDPANPLTARVTVNRFWQMYFGTGIVKTVEDFGSQGEWPTHPELLDWLATEFVQSGWDVKRIVKTIVMSATYRQSSAVTPELIERDPENRLLARGPRFRLPAETVRDQALAISGLLVEQLGGPSVKPYQPKGLWTELAGGRDYQPDSGDKLYRRSMYTFWKRAVAPPSMMNFDSAGREACSVRATRTNTPLQALNLMNDVTYVEASRKMGERMMREGGATASERIAYGFRLATARLPRSAESEIFQGSYQHYLDLYRTGTAAAEKFLSEGESPRDPALDAAELAAYTTVASLILNLDETITKE